MQFSKQDLSFGELEKEDQIEDRIRDEQIVKSLGHWDEEHINRRKSILLIIMFTFSSLFPNK